MTNSDMISKTELLQRIEQTWETLHNYLKMLTTDQLEKYTDAVGWTVKDHLTHLMTWEDDIYGLLSKQPRWQQMNVDQALWDEMKDTADFESIYLKPVLVNMAKMISC